MKHDEMISRLADIVPPTPPAWDQYLPAVMTIAVLALLVGAWWMLRYARSRQRSLRLHTARHDARSKLAALEAEWRAGLLTDRAAAYRLATVLRLGLDLTQLTPGTHHPAVNDHATWSETVNLLQQLRYHPRPQHRLTPAIFAHAADWLSAANLTREMHPHV